MIGVVAGSKGCITPRQFVFAFEEVFCGGRKAPSGTVTRGGGGEDSGSLSPRRGGHAEPSRNTPITESPFRKTAVSVLRMPPGASNAGGGDDADARAFGQNLRL